jgi:hypothetical protein
MRLASFGCFVPNVKHDFRLRQECPAKGAVMFVVHNENNSIQPPSQQMRVTA